MSRRSLSLLALAVSSVSFPVGPLGAQGAADPAQPGPSPAPLIPPLAAPGPGAAPPAAEETLPLADAAAPRRYSFEEASLSRVFRLLARQAGIDYIEPPLDPAEKISFEFSNVTPFQAFQIIAQRRGFRVVQNNGIYELVRDDLRNPNQATQYATRTYSMRNTDARLLFEGVANLLGFTVTAPDGITKGYPKPQDVGSISSLSSGGGSSGGSSSSGSSSGGSSSSSSSGGGSDTGGEGKFTSGFPIAAAYAERQATDAGEKEFAFTDRGNVLVVRTTLQNHDLLDAYFRRVDRLEDSIVVEVKVLSLRADKSKDIGSDWSLFFGRDSAGNPLFSLDLGGGSVPPNNAGGNVGVGGSGFPQDTTVFGSIAAGIVGGFSYSSFGYFLRDFQVAGRIALLKRNDRLYDMSQPTVITKSGVPVTISSLTEEPVQNFTQGLNNTTVNSSSTALSTSIQTFKYGILLDVLATELRDGYVDMTVTPRISAKLGETNSQLPIIQANTTTTNVTVPPGRTVAIGGVLELNEARELRETPGLSKIPLIGKYLFARRGRSLTRTNVVILVTPRIIHAGNGSIMTGGCDEEHVLELSRSYGAKFQEGRSKNGIKPTRTFDPADPDDPFDAECVEKAIPVPDGKAALPRR